MKKIPEHIEVLMAQYFEGSISVEEEKVLQGWLAQSEENQKVFNSTKKLWNVSEKVTPRQFNIDAAWKKVAKRTSEKEEVTDNSVLIKLRPFLYRAAAILVIGFLSLFVYLQLNNSVNDVEYLATKAKTELYLPDSSFISLNKSAVLTYPERFNNDERRVKLEGEAFFDVTHDPKKPFIIEAGSIEVTVLGTEFYVVALPESRKVEVTVKSGKVKVQSLVSKENRILTAKETVTYLFDNEAFLEKKELNQVNYDWNNNLLVFKNEPLDQVFQVIEKEFDVVIDFNQNLSKCNISSRFETSDAEEVIKQICLLFELEYSRKSNKYLIAGNPNCK